MENLGVVVPLGLGTTTPSKTHKFNNLLSQLYSLSPGPHLSPEVKSVSLFQQVFFIFQKNYVANRESLAKLSRPLFLGCLSISRDREIMCYFWSSR